MTDSENPILKVLREKGAFKSSAMWDTFLKANDEFHKNDKA